MPVMRSTSRNRKPVATKPRSQSKGRAPAKKAPVKKAPAKKAPMRKMTPLQRAHNAFVKKEMAALAKAHPRMTPQKKMAKVGAAWRAHKRATGK